jgi:hypothetical protein
VSRRRTATFAAPIALAALCGCVSPRKPRVEREPERTTPAESDQRRIVRIQETERDLSDKVTKWLVEVEAHHAREPEDAELGAAIEGLREVRDRLDRVRAHANRPDVGPDLDALERELVSLEGAAERQHERALRAVER